MHIRFIGTQKTEGFRLPGLFTVSGYKVKPTPNATKIWLTKSGGCILASNGSKIPPKELNELMEFISAQFFMICAEWKHIDVWHSSAALPFF